MATSPFRRAAVVCTMLTVSIGLGAITPAVAIAATPTPSTASAAQSSPIDGISVDPALAAPQALSIVDNLSGARVLMGTAGSDDVWLLDGDTIMDRSVGDGGLFQIFVQDKHKDSSLDLVRVHTAADDTQTRTERMPLPRTLQVTGLQEQNTFTPGTRHFTGTATAGSTITATDRSGAELFSTKASDARTSGGTWSADADLTAGSDHVVTFTQTTTTGASSVISNVTFTPADQQAPAAPVLETPDRLLNGDFSVRGAVSDDTTSVEVRDASSTVIAEADVRDGHFAATVPQDHLGSTVSVVSIAADGSASAPARATLAPLPVDASVTSPAVRQVNVLPSGAIQIIGERQDTLGVQVLDGDRVVGDFDGGSIGWSFRIGHEFTGKQLDLVALGFDGQRLHATSERVALPRLLQVDGIAESNTYQPGERTFSGSAEAGATISATDQDGRELFRTEARGARSGVGTWSASADLSSRSGYTVTFTQTTTDGRTSVMEDIAFDAEPQQTVPVSVTTKSVTAGVSNHFEGTATPGATFRVLNPSGTQIVPGTHDVAADGTWSFDRVVSRGATKLDFVIEQTVDGTPTKSGVFSIAATSIAPVMVTTTSVTAGVSNPFEGTATPGATYQVLNPSGTQIVPGTHDVAADGTWSFDRVVSRGATKLDFVIEQTVSGATIKSGTFSLTAR